MFAQHCLGKFFFVLVRRKIDLKTAIIHSCPQELINLSRSYGFLRTKSKNLSSSADFNTD